MFDLNEQHDASVHTDNTNDVESADVQADVSTDVSEEASSEPKKLKIRTSKPTPETAAKNKSQQNIPSQPEADENYVPGEKKNWYILKVQVNREDAIKESIKRRVAIAGLDVYFGDILVPTEKVTEFRSGKKRIIKKKLYPGYIMILMEITEETWFLVRETPGIGDFTGAAGKPTPMLPHEVQRILMSEKADTEDSPKLKIGYQVGDKIKVKDGTFENFEGEVHQIDMSNGRVTVMINIFGRSTPVELEYWQIETPN